jgi:integrase
VTTADVEGFLHDIADGKTAATVKTGQRGLARVTGGEGAANRAVRLLGGVFSWAIKRGMRSDNPCRGVTQYEDRKKDRRLSKKEYRALGAALKKAEGWPAAPAAIAFATLTGWRIGEVLGLQWSSIDLEKRTATLAQTKSGKSIRPLSKAACALLERSVFPREGLVFPPSRGDKLLTMKKTFGQFTKRAGLPSDVTPHVLRHSYASEASDLGFSELTIAMLVGHKNRSMTSRYTHTADEVLLAAADKVSEKIQALMAG